MREDRHFKKPLRYKGHDYRAPCIVHVTICTHNRQPVFGSVHADGVSLSDAGRFVEQTLVTLHSDQEGIAVDTHIVMPDHLHAIVMLGTNPHVITRHSIPDLVKMFKLRIFRAWPRGVREQGWPRYKDHLWQVSYHDTLIRNEAHLETTRQYILGNPGRWWERMQCTHL